MRRLRINFYGIHRQSFIWTSTLMQHEVAWVNNLLSCVLIALLLLTASALLFRACSICYSPLLPAHAQERQQASDSAPSEEQEMPKIYGSNLRAQLVYKGLDKPTTMAFLGPDDILVLEKDKGTVQRIINGTISPEPLLDVNVATSVERGMCGIAVSRSMSGHTYVFLYYTESETTDGDDITEGKAPLGNRLYRYELVNGHLANPKLLLDIPAEPGPRYDPALSPPGRHNGGAILIGPDNLLYIPVGDLDKSTLSQNLDAGKLDGSGAILRIAQDGQAAEGIFDGGYPLNLYYAYGIRNSFGIDFDPITGNLWDTENGASNNDEINLVEPGFNSGWLKVQGVASDEFDSEVELMTLGGKGHYSDPEFIWKQPVGVSAIKFFDSSKMGKKYEGDMFVSDYNYGNIYHFDLSQDRRHLAPEDFLIDEISDTNLENNYPIFADGLEGISDLEVGPYDGYLYVVSYKQGAIYKIVP